MSEFKKVIIVGDHPMKDNITHQFITMGYSIIDVDTLDDYKNCMECRDIVLFPKKNNNNPINNDAELIQTLEEFNRLYNGYITNRPTVHVLFQCQETIHLLNTREYDDEWHKHFELNAFTIEDIWAKNVIYTGVENSRYVGLDYKPICFESNNTIHLVLIGTSQLTTSIAEHASLIAHYPNYTRNHSLRTRITIIDNAIEEWSGTFISMHKALMENSYYRFIDINKRACDLHKPMYEGKREDFVDIEWEFVKGTIHDVIIQDKLNGWLNDDNQVLSVAVCHKSDTLNLSESMLIADISCEHNIPIYVKQETNNFSYILTPSHRLRNLIMIGMENHGYNVTLPLLRMARRINAVYEYCYYNNTVIYKDGCITAPSYIDDNEAERSWLNVTKSIKRNSNISNAMTLPTKMRSLGHSMTDDTFYAITKHEIEVISEVEHNRWCVEELLLGYRPCTDEELSEIKADINKKNEYKKRLIHYDLRSYSDLQTDITGKNVNTYDICISASIPLIAYHKKGGGEA